MLFTVLDSGSGTRRGPVPYLSPAMGGAAIVARLGPVPRLGPVAEGTGLGAGRSATDDETEADLCVRDVRDGSTDEGSVDSLDFSEFIRVARFTIRKAGTAGCGNVEESRGRATGVDKSTLGRVKIDSRATGGRKTGAMAGGQPTSLVCEEVLAAI